MSIFCFSKSHIQTFADAMPGMFDSKLFSDVTLVCEGDQIIKCHKLILATFSPVFKQIFLNSQSEMNCIYLRGCDYDTVLALVQFMYTAELHIQGTKVNNFMDLAREFQINTATQEIKETKNEGLAININHKKWVCDIDVEKNEIRKSLFEADDNVNDKHEEEEESDPMNKTQKNWKNDDIEIVSPRIGLEDSIDGSSNNRKSLFDDEEINETKTSALSLEKNQYNINQEKNLILSRDEDILKSWKNYVHVDPITKIQTCHICDKQFHPQPNGSYSSSLKEHITGLHHNVKIKCDQCDFRTSYQRNIREHKRDCHDKLKVSCEFCGGQYNKKYLDRHKRIHNGKLKCGECKFETTTGGVLKDHVDFFHKGIIRFACSQCNFKTHRKTNLNLHENNQHK